MLWNVICNKKDQDKRSIILCHYRLGIEPQTRNRGARQVHDPSAIPLSAIIIDYTFSCLLPKALQFAWNIRQWFRFSFLSSLNIFIISHTGWSPEQHYSWDVIGRHTIPFALNEKWIFFPSPWKCPTKTVLGGIFPELNIPSKNFLAHRKGGRVNGRLLEREIGWKTNNQKRRHSILGVGGGVATVRAQQTHVDLVQKSEERKKEGKKMKRGGSREEVN